MLVVIPRQKACLACAESKRRCDKQLPECQRCLDRDVDCVYPQPPKRRRRDTSTRDSQSEVSIGFKDYSDPSALPGSLEFGDWNALSGVDHLDIPLSDVIIPYLLPTPSASIAPLEFQGFVAENNDGSNTPSNTPRPWFLEDQTWVLHHSDQQPACVTVVQLEPFIRAVEEMLQFWVRNGYNSFIHQRLYEEGMPTCLQDAFTTLAAYTSRTLAVKDIILQIAEERSSALVRQTLPPASGAKNIQAHLARVQALFIYEFILLFDGSVRVRASAEQHLPTLRRWVTQLWEASKGYRGEDGFPGQDSLQWTTNEFDREFTTSSHLWRLWTLTESVRRTHVIVDTILNIYQIMTRGWADCCGGVMVTARRGLWEARSAVEWFDLSCAKPPLLVPFLQPGSFISQCAAEECDEFVKMCWTFIAGTDKIQSWIDRSGKGERIGSRRMGFGTS